jgi:hypothetical protein
MSVAFSFNILFPRVCLVSPAFFLTKLAGGIGKKTIHPTRLDFGFLWVKAQLSIGWEFWFRGFESKHDVILSGWIC